MATYAASRHRAIGTRPVRGMLLRTSNVCQIHIEPRGKIHNPAGRRHSNIAEVPRAVPRGNIHAPAKRDGQVRVIAANAHALIECLHGCSGGTRLQLIVRRRYGYERNRGSPAPAPNPVVCSRTAAMRLPTEGPFRNSGCPAGTPVFLPADPQRHVALHREPQRREFPNLLQLRGRKFAFAPAARRSGCTSFRTRPDMR